MIDRTSEIIVAMLAVIAPAIMFGRSYISYRGRQHSDGKFVVDVSIACEFDEGEEIIINQAGRRMRCRVAAIVLQGDRATIHYDRLDVAE
jgi:hypothetical protein